MIDLHAHLLPGIDDGPPDLPAALALADAAVRNGTRIMAATPHIGFTHGVAPGALSTRADDLRAALAEEGIPLEVAAGGELAPDRALDLSDGELGAIALGDGRCVLLECPFTHAGDLMARLVSHLQMRGFRVLLAHPERSPAYLADAGALGVLVERGAFVQLTAGLLARRLRRHGAPRLPLVPGAGARPRDRLRRACRRGSALPELAGIVTAELAEWRQDPALATWLCADAPRALLDDEDLPPAPAWRARRRLLRRR